jgi:deoxyguanosine kinase
VGKTSLAHRLADYLDAQLLLEQPELNPYLSRFYQDQARFALQTQLCFLFQRLDKLRELARPDFFLRPLVADFMLERILCSLC